MRTLSLRLLLIVACVAVLAVGALADVPSNLTVTRGVYQWVWASPCAPEQPSCGNTLTLTNGWTIPTAAEWTASFVDTADIYNAFTLNGTGQLCGSPYFNSGYTWCDSSDLQSGYIWGAPVPISNGYGEYYSTSEGFLVRTATPEPGSMLLFGSGVLGIVGVIRRKINL